MGRALTIAVALVLAWTASARADAGLADAGIGDGAAEDAAQGCGALTYQGECVGTLLRYCVNDDTINQIECAEYDLRCGLVDCEEEDCLGFNCVAAEGGSCVDLDCDVSLGHGCLDGVCAPSETCDPPRYLERCEGPVHVFCPTGRVWNYDCSNAGQHPATCGGGSAGEPACLPTEGGQCDLQQEIWCAPGLVCDQGFCRVGGPVDGGTVAHDAAAEGRADGATDDDSDGNGACACRGQRGGRAGLVPIVSLALLLSLRRRRRGSGSCSEPGLPVFSRHAAVRRADRRGAGR